MIKFYIFIITCISISNIFISSSSRVTNKILSTNKFSTSELFINNIDENIYKKVYNLIKIRGGKKKSKNSIIKSLSSWFFNCLKSILPSSWTEKKKYNINKSKSNKDNNNKQISDSSNNRIQKELQSFLTSPPDNCKLTVGKNIRSWIVTLTGVEGTIFAGEEYKLQIKFPKEYPTKPPSVYFLKPCPKHMHVYSNGDICLNLLGRDWRPNLTVSGIVVSILSMLSSAKEKSMPQDNAMHAEAAPGQQQDNWMYHDDKC